MMKMTLLIVATLLLLNVSSANDARQLPDNELKRIDTTAIALHCHNDGAYVLDVVNVSVDSYIESHCLKQVNLNGTYISNPSECSDSLIDLLIKIKGTNPNYSDVCTEAILKFKKRYDIF